MDLAYTIESPANQLKILEQQLQRLQIALGEMFEIAMKNILPILNGFTMALVEVVHVVTEFIKMLVGYKDDLTETDRDNGISDSLSDLIDGMEEANKQADELEKHLLGIDELNIIDKNQNSVFGEIDPTILAAFSAALKDWNNRMDEVQMKAYAIRDAILEWIGLEPINGSWGLAEGATLIKTILEWVYKIQAAYRTIKEDLEKYFNGENSILGTIIDNVKTVWGWVDGILLTLLQISNPLWSAIFLITYGLYQFKSGTADMQTVFNILDGIGLALLYIGLLLNSKPLAGVGLLIYSTTEFLRDLSKALEDGNLELSELAELILDIALFVLAVSLMNSLQQTFGWVSALWILTKELFRATGILIWETAKNIVLALGGNSAAIAELSKLITSWKILGTIMLKVVGVILIIKSVLGIFQDFADMVNGVTHPVEGLYKILTKLAGILAIIAALTGNWALLGGAAATWAILKAGEFSMGITDSDIDKRREEINKAKEQEEKNTSGYDNELNGLFDDYNKKLEEIKKQTGVVENNVEVNVQVNNDLKDMENSINAATSTNRYINNTYRLGYANGGYPDKGLFMMNEGSSAEMLGTINGRTAVVNNEQIASALAGALTPLLGSVVTAIQDVAGNDRPIILNIDSRQAARATTNGNRKLGYNQIGGEFANV